MLLHSGAGLPVLYHVSLLLLPTGMVTPAMTRAGSVPALLCGLV
jgi:hypothetical protein